MAPGPRMSRRAHEDGDCNGDWTCPWCWDDEPEPEHDPDLVDEIALERAAAGDLTVWAAFTPAEKRLAMVEVLERRTAELDENDEWRLALKRHTPGGRNPIGVVPNVGRNGTPEWLAEVVAAAGYVSVETFMRAARRMAKES